VHHRHQELCSDGERRCTEVFTAFQREHGRRPVRVLFPATGEHGPGYPGESGVVVDYRNPSCDINLNRPRVARLLIEVALAEGWSPATSPGQFVLSNGFHLLREHSATFEAALATTTA
jgi:hypothetical protein